MDEERLSSETTEESEPFLLSRRAFLGMGVAATAALALESTAAAASPNRQASREPASPPAQPTKLTPTQRASIVKARIHPGFGMMRVGNSTDAFYLGPEVPGAIPKGKTTYRDDSGAVARQGVRFRIFGYDADGNVVGEITKADAILKWAAHLANTKAAWYRFDGAMDIPEGHDETRRNPDVTGGAREDLVLDAGKQLAVQGSSVQLQASAMGVTKLLGELMLDAKGHLIVLPGVGKAESWEDGSHVYTYANNNAWLDDMADGPVTAIVRMDGRKLKAEGAWVAAGPPNYAPGVATGWRTLHDVLEDVWVTGGLSTAGETVSSDATSCRCSRTWHASSG